jgi:hypothetical protein
MECLDAGPFGRRSQFRLAMERRPGRGLQFLPGRTFTARSSPFATFREKGGLSGYPGARRLRYAAFTSDALALSMALR